MSTSEIKKQLHLHIDMIDDEDKLALLNDTAEAYISKQPDIIDLLSPVQLNRLEQSVKQADEGKTISNEEVMKMSKEWMKTHIR